MAPESVFDRLNRPPGMAIVPPDVPRALRATYAELSGVIASFAARVPTTPDLHAVQMWPQLNYASDRNAPFGQYALDNIRNEIRQHAGYGATGVTIHMSCPGLDPQFYAGGASDPAFLALQSVWAQTIIYAHSVGLSVLAECVVPVGSDPAWKAYMTGLPWPAYKASRARHAVAVATLGPDWLSVLTEPDSEAQAAGKAVDTIPVAIDLVTTVVGAVRLAVPSVKLAAGCGTWMSNLTGAGSWVENLLSTRVDALDCHIYPCYVPAGGGASYLERLYDVIAAIGPTKQLVMTEVWANKQAASEADVDFAAIEARNGFAFWYPLDVQLLQALSSLQAKTPGFVAFSPSYPQTFQTSLDPDVYLSQSPEAISTALGLAYDTALQAGAVTTLAQEAARVATQGDTTTLPPAPGSLVDSAHTQATVILTWTWATPQLRQQRINLYRDGVLIYSGAGRPGWGFSYRDSGLSRGATYVYSCEAADCWDNRSLPLRRPVTL